VAFHGALHFDAEAVVRCDEVGADQEQDDVGALERLVDGLIDLLTGRDAMVGPEIQQALALE
jgi:hypothetical protein